MVWYLMLMDTVRGGWGGVVFDVDGHCTREVGWSGI